MNQVSELIIAKNSLVSLSMTGENKEDQVQTFQEQIEYSKESQRICMSPL